MLKVRLSRSDDVQKNVYSARVIRGVFVFKHEFVFVSGLVAADPVMARLLGAIYVTVMVIVCLNILIAYLSNTFTSVYSKAVENTSMQRAINILTVEKFLTKNRREIYFRYVRENASPEMVSSSSSVVPMDVRQVAKSAEQVQKDFKKSHEVLTQRFSKKVGKGKISAFDVLLEDVEKLKILQNSTVIKNYLGCFPVSFMRANNPPQSLEISCHRTVFFRSMT